MNDRHRKLTRHPDIRGLFSDMVADADALPRRSEVVARIDEAFPTAPPIVKNVILHEATQLAKQAQSTGGYHGRRGAKLELRQQADETALEWIARADKWDRLVDLPEDDQPDPTTPPRTNVLNELGITFQGDDR